MSAGAVLASVDAATITSSYVRHYMEKDGIEADATVELVEPEVSALIKRLSHARKPRAGATPGKVAVFTSYIPFPNGPEVWELTSVDWNKVSNVGARWLLRHPKALDVDDVALLRNPNAPEPEEIEFHSTVLQSNAEILETQIAVSDTVGYSELSKIAAAVLYEVTFFDANPEQADNFKVNLRKNIADAIAESISENDPKGLTEELLDGILTSKLPYMEALAWESKRMPDSNLCGTAVVAMYNRNIDIVETVYTETAADKIGRRGTYAI